jgi:hypothetical protein
LRTLTTIWIVLTSSLAMAQVEDFALVSFKKADSIAGLFPKHSLTDLQSLANKLTQPLSRDVEKFRAIYMWVCLNIENDYNLFLRFKNQNRKPNQKHKPNSDKNYRADVFHILRTKHKTTCTGYAYLVRELATRAGLSCKIINGYGRTAHVNVGGQGFVNHAWNVVQLNNKWYLCDATWSSGIIDGDKHQFVMRFDDTYFLLRPELFARNHYPKDTAWFLLSDKPALDQFLNQPILYASTLKHQLQIQTPSRFSIQTTKGDTIALEFDQPVPKNFERVEIKIVELGEVRSFFPIPEAACNNAWKITHTFKSRGIRTLHVFLDNEPVCSYQVTVR